MTAEIRKQLDDVIKLSESDENKRRLACWENPENAIRGENQWHGYPKGTAPDGDTMPVTAELLDTVLAKDIGFRMDTYFTETEYFLRYYLEMKIKRFQEFPDDTPLTLEIPVWFGVVWEAALLGQEVKFFPEEYPAFAKASAISDDFVLPEKINFTENEFFLHAKSFYEKVKSIVGNEFKVTFPYWYRGPQGVALYLRGFEQFFIDLYVQPELAERILRYVTDAAKSYYTWRENFTGEKQDFGDLFNDDIPSMSPDSYKETILPYEKELADFYGGVYYWHSCGDITKHVPLIAELPNLQILDFGVSMEEKSPALEKLENKKQVLELRTLAQKYIQNSTEEATLDYMRNMVSSVKKSGIEKYVLRSSGMSIVHGVNEDIRRLARWVELSRKAQEEVN
jgi:uroporphyrinogen-III decarboxylase